MFEFLCRRREKLKSPLVRDTFIYTITDSIGKGVGFLLLPLVSFYVTPDELGIATNFVVLTQIASLLAGLAIVNSLPYFYYEQTKEQNQKLVSSLLFICMVLCVSLLLLDWLLNSFLSDSLKLDIGLQVYAIICVACTLIGGVNFQLLRLQDKSLWFAGIQLVQTLIHCALVLLFVVELKWGGRGKIYADTGAVILLSIVHLLLMFKQQFLSFKIEKSYCIKLLKFGVPLLPHSLSFWLKSGVDKIFITQYGGGLFSNGLYSMALTLMSIFSLVSNGFFRAYNPALQKRLANIKPENEKNEKLKIVKLTYLCLTAFLILALLTIALSWVILNYMVDDKYKESFIFIPWLVTGLFINIIYSFAIEFIYKMKKTLVLGLITFTGSLIQMVLTYYFVKQWDALGAAYSALVGYVLISIAIFIYSCKVYPMPWFNVFNLPLLKRK